MKLMILSGLPGSGKSTWAKIFVSENKDWVRVNRDDIRNMRGLYWIPKQEDMITDMENQCCIIAFQHGYNVILDATNLNSDRNKARFLKFKEQFPELSVEYKNFDTALEICIQQDLMRPNSVGANVITDMYYKYLAPAIVVYNEDINLDHCVIFDIDGTLAKMCGRSPYDWHRVHEDTVNKPVAELAKLLWNQGKKIIIFTGRDGVCLKSTEKWLVDNGVFYNEIYIRPEGNTEKDSIIKKRMFEENIRGKYYCSLVVDDRNQVVDMWRKELGLPCFQVDYGNF